MTPEADMPEQQPDHGIAMAGQVLCQVVVAAIAVGRRDDRRQIRAIVIPHRHRELANPRFAGLVPTVLEQNDRKRARRIQGITDVTVNIRLVALPSDFVLQGDAAEVIVLIRRRIRPHGGSIRRLDRRPDRGCLAGRRSGAATIAGHQKQQQPEGRDTRAHRVFSSQARMATLAGQKAP